MSFRPATLPFNPPKVIFNPPKVIFGPPTITFGPPTVIFNPATIVFGPATVMFSPPTACFGPATVIVGPVIADAAATKTAVAGPKPASARFSVLAAFATSDIHALGGMDEDKAFTAENAEYAEKSTRPTHQPKCFRTHGATECRHG